MASAKVSQASMATFNIGIDSINKLKATDAKLTYDNVQNAHPTLLQLRPQTGPGSGNVSLVKALQKFVKDHPNALPPLTSFKKLTPTAAGTPPGRPSLARSISPVGSIRSSVNPGPVMAPLNVIGGMISDAMKLYSKPMMDQMALLSTQVANVQQGNYQQGAPDITYLTSADVLSQLDVLSARRGLTMGEYHRLNPQQRQARNIDHHIEAINREEARLNELYVELNTQESKDARASIKRKAAQGNSGPPSKRAGTKPTSTNHTAFADPDGILTSDAEEESGDGCLTPTQNSTPKPKEPGSVSFEDTLHMTDMCLDAYNKEVAGAMTWGKDSNDLVFRREGLAYHSLLTSVRTFALKSHRLIARGIRAMDKAGKDDIKAGQALSEQMIGEILAKTARSQIVRKLAVSLSWDQAENAETMAPPIHATTPTLFNTFVQGATNSVLKYATKRSTSMNANQLGKPQPGLIMYQASTPQQSSGSGSSRPNNSNHPLCPYVFCNRNHLPPCHLACKKCTGNPPYKKNHAGPCKV